MLAKLSEKIALRLVHMVPLVLKLESLHHSPN